ncbi:MAG: hypothetical protein MUF85_02585, partial [Patescibacteria group bacterium]|nr:hypothetical protein [Patescibacteria group bacterium]
MQEISNITDHVAFIMILSIISFIVAMALTPIYTHFAYKYKWWKKRDRTLSTSGDKLSVVAQQRIKRTIPRMAGIVMVVSIAIVTLALNLDRGQTWLPLAALIGGGLIGIIDDAIYVSGKGGGVVGAGLFHGSSGPFTRLFKPWTTRLLPSRRLPERAPAT